MDREMLRGCTLFVASSLISYFMGVWPFVAFAELLEIRRLAFALAFSAIPVAIFVAFLARRGGVPGLTGSLAGVFAITIFLFLRMKQFLLGLEIRDLPQPEFPADWMWKVPALYLATMLAIGGIAAPRSEKSPSKPRFPSQ